MKNNQKLSSVDIHPRGIPERIIIWLHGLGADGNDFAPIVPELHLPDTLNIKYIFPHAPVMPVTINNGYEMRAWFDIQHPDLSLNIDHSGIEQSIKSINTLIHEEIDQGIAPENIMLAGFSQGAVIATLTGILFSERLAGVIALSGLLPNAEPIINQGSPANRNLPIFMGHGTQDQIVPLVFGEAAHQILVKANYPVEWHTYPMAHSVCPQEIMDISNWIQKIWI
ncbi:MAG TPA: dienelactone hydrolase family protein [Gammaproteobacteria bacterium]|jgi:phospholipase/carboxylesterase|nr:dienelactone hydrolase family protein [Gammaproteobacteria bacterium]